jgi:CMP-N-acetylneuraminate monooxygenase
LYATSFGGGANGYPFMIENFKTNDQKKIHKVKTNFLKVKKKNNLEKIKPIFFLPYASFFKEKLDRDKNMLKLNIKNKITDYKKICDNNNIKLLNVEKFDEFYFNKKKLVRIKKNNTKNSKDLNPKKYLEIFRNKYNKIDIDYIKNYFIYSNYKDNLILYVSLTDHSFDKSAFSFKVDFRKTRIQFMVINDHKEKNLTKTNNNKLFLRCRKEAFLKTIYNKEPWEDFFIGFQCKELRVPNIYHGKFWFHFTNFYITKKHVRSSLNCMNCEIINQKIDNEIFSSMKKNYKLSL